MQQPSMLRHFRIALIAFLVAWLGGAVAFALLVAARWSRAATGRSPTDCAWAMTRQLSRPKKRPRARAYTKPC